MHSSFSLLSRYLSTQKLRVTLLALCILAGIGVQLANPQIMRYVLDQAEAGAPQRQLLLAAGIFLIFSLTQAAATLGTNYLGADVSWNATNRLRADLTRHILHLDMGFHNAHTPGELIERVDGDVSRLANFFSQLVLRLAANALLVTGVIVLLSREDWRMGLAAATYAAVIVVFLQTVQGRSVRLWTAVSEAEADLNSLLEERLSGREDVRTNGGEGYVLRRLALALGQAFRAFLPARLLDVFTFATTRMLLVVTTALSLGAGIYLFLNGRTTLGTVYVIVYYLGLLENPLSELRRLITELQAAAASAQRVRALFHRQPAVAMTSTLQAARPLPAGSLAVDFEDVSFHYAAATADDTARPAVLVDVSFHLAAGRVLGLLGRTGSGKTTLTRLLFRLYDAVDGCVRLAGEDVRNLPVADLRRRVGMVTQDVQLFGGTLRDNITLFDPAVDDEAILAALRQLGLWTWFLAQPDGLDTRLESGGSGLSAGEAQLLAFVRIFLKDPGLIILDEASSRLDPATEQLLEQAIDRLLRGRTAIIIAHRLDTVQRADDILILDQGRVAETGPRTTLAADPSSRLSSLLRTGMQEALR